MQAAATTSLATRRGVRVWRWLVGRPQALLLSLIALYRRAVSPLLGPRCRFLPTCSEYAASCISRDGAILGSLRAARRLLRCHPWGGSGYDPP